MMDVAIHKMLESAVVSELVLTVFIYFLSIKKRDHLIFIQHA